MFLDKHPKDAVDGSEILHQVDMANISVFIVLHISQLVQHFSSINRITIPNGCGELEVHPRRCTEIRPVAGDFLSGGWVKESPKAAINSMIEYVLYMHLEPQ